MYDENACVEVANISTHYKLNRGGVPMRNKSAFSRYSFVHFRLTMQNPSSFGPNSALAFLHTGGVGRWMWYTVCRTEQTRLLIVPWNSTIVHSKINLIYNFMKYEGEKRISNNLFCNSYLHQSQQSWVVAGNTSILVLHTHALHRIHISREAPSTALFVA